MVSHRQLSSSEEHRVGTPHLVCECEGVLGAFRRVVIRLKDAPGAAVDVAQY